MFARVRGCSLVRRPQKDRSLRPADERQSGLYMVVTIRDGQIVEMKGCADRAVVLSYVQADGRP
jgi:hypothetical protein